MYGGFNNSTKQCQLFKFNFSLIAVALGAGAAGTLNMWYESDLDALMTRTCLRPIPTGQVTKNQALLFGIILSIASVSLLYYSSNLMSTFLLLLTICFYFFIYTVWLKKKNTSKYSDRWSSRRITTSNRLDNCNRNFNY